MCCKDQQEPSAPVASASVSNQNPITGGVAFGLAGNACRSAVSALSVNDAAPDI
jgi:hypothetical protein